MMEAYRPADMACLLCLQCFCGHSSGRHNRIFDHCKVGIHQVFGHNIFNFHHRARETIIFVEVPFKLIAELFGAKLGVIHLIFSREQRVDAPRRCLIPSHKLGSAYGRKPAEGCQGLHQACANLLTKLHVKPVLHVPLHRNGCHCMDVPRHVHEQIKLICSHFRVVDSHHPQAVGTAGISRLHLAANQSGLCGAQPEVVVGLPLIAKVIECSAMRGVLAVGIGTRQHVAVAVVSPQQADVDRFFAFV